MYSANLKRGGAVARLPVQQAVALEVLSCSVCAAGFTQVCRLSRNLLA